MADKYQLPILPDLLNAAMILEQAGQYDRSKSGLTGLLCYLPELPKAKSVDNHLWNRSEKLDTVLYMAVRSSLPALSLQMKL